MKVHDPERIMELTTEGCLTVGRWFVFLKPRPGLPGLEWLGSHPRVITRVDRAVDLPGLSLPAAGRATLELAVVASDRSLYAENSDPIHLLLCDPMHPGERHEAAIYLDDRLLRTAPVALDSLGVCHLVLAGLGSGRYQVRWKSARCSFRVAGFRLAPLLGTVQDQTREADRLRLTLRVETYGVPVDGRVSVELVDGDEPLTRAEGVARGGRLEVLLPLVGRGPLSIHLQLVEDPARTATVPLPGSKLGDREPTCLSELGRRLTASLLPAEGSQAVRGLFLSQEGPEQGPLALERLPGGRVRLRARSRLEGLSLVLADPMLVEHDPVPRPGLPGAGAVLARTLIEGGSRQDARALLERPGSGEEWYLRACCQPGATAAGCDLRRALQEGYRPATPPPAGSQLPDLRVTREFGTEVLEPGQSLDVELTSPMTMLAVGGFAQGKAWEGAAFLPSPGPGLRLTLPASLPPDQTAELVLEGSAEQAYVVVKDARLLTPETPGSALASRLKAYAEAPLPAAPSLTPPRPVRLAVPIASGAMRRMGELGEELVRQGLLTARQLERARSAAQSSGEPLASLLTGMGYVSARDLAEVMGQQMGVGFVDIHSDRLDPQVARCIPEHLARRYQVLPVDLADNRLRLAMVDPLNLFAIDDIRLITGFDIDPVMATEESLMRALNRTFGVSDLAEVEETVKDISAQDFGPLEFEESIDLDRLRASVDEASLLHRPKAAQEVQEAPRTLFAGLVRMESGTGRVCFRPGGSAPELVVEALALSPGDWTFETARVAVKKSPHLGLEVPAYVQPGDVAMGRVQVVAGQGAMRLVLTRDEEPVLDQAMRGGEQVSFPAFPGTYRAELTEDGGACDRARAEVSQPGRLRREVEVVRWLAPGQGLGSEDPDLLGFRVLTGVGGALGKLVEATANYEHCCCEQTASVILAACAVYLLNGTDPPRRQWAEGVILAGLERESRMHLKGRGFKGYPEWPDQPDTCVGPIAALNLWNLALLKGERLSPALAEGVERGLSMAEDATRAYRLQWPPEPPRDARETYAVARWGAPKEQAGALERARRAAGHLPGSGSSVVERTELAFTAATLLRLGDESDRPAALELADRVLRQLEACGRLYSTLDSVAAIALVGELAARSSPGRLELDDRVQSASEAAGDEYRTGRLEVLEGHVPVQLRVRRCEDWTRGETGLLKAWLEVDGRPARRVTAGDRACLRWRLTGSYEMGDLVWICLPDALSRLEGGGQLKLLCVDLRGQLEGSLGLVATGPTPAGPQHFLMCLRNMYLEDRLGPSELLSVEVEPRAGSGPGGVREPALADLVESLYTPRAALYRALGEEAEAALATDGLLARLASSPSGVVELGTGREEAGWMRWGSDPPAPLPSRSCLKLGARLMLLAGLSLSEKQPQEGTLSLEGRSYRLLTLPTDAGLRARLCRQEAP
ncbi:MAG: hypothetical protein AB1758_01535 [Candidatus Eremiobacterota bacterium]